MFDYYSKCRPATEKDGPEHTGGEVIICHKCGGESFRVIKWESGYSTDVVCVNCNTQVNVHGG